MREAHSIILFRLWRRAEERAASAEKTLFDAVLLSSTGGPAPTEDEWRRAKELRSEATDLFRAAMDEVQRANEEAARLTTQVTNAQRAAWKGGFR
jgi:hypothetical protein